MRLTKQHSTDTVILSSTNVVESVNRSISPRVKALVLDTSSFQLRGFFCAKLAVQDTDSAMPLRTIAVLNANETTGIIDQGQPDADRSESKSGVTDKRATVATQGRVAPLTALDNSVVKLDAYSLFEAIAINPSLPRLLRVTHCH